MAREPELSIKVKVDPQIDTSELQQGINQKLPQNGIEIKSHLNPQELIRDISRYQTDESKYALILGKLSNAKEALSPLEKETAELSASLTSNSLNHIKEQLQGVINELDTSKIGNSIPQSSAKTSKKASKKSASKTLPVDVTFAIDDDAISNLRTQIQNGLTLIPITFADISPDQIKALRGSVENALKGIEFAPIADKVKNSKKQPEVEQLSFLSQEPVKTPAAKKSRPSLSDDKILEQMANAQAAAIKSEEAEAAVAKQKDIIYQNLTNHQAKAAENASDATAQTAQGLSNANKTMGDLNAKAEEFGQDWRQVVTLIASATKNLAELMVGNYGFKKDKKGNELPNTGKGMEVFESFNEFTDDLPVLDPDYQSVYLKQIKDWADSLLNAANEEFDANTVKAAIHMFSGLSDAWSKIDVDKLTNASQFKKTKEALLENITDLQSIIPMSGQGGAFWGAKDSAINYLAEMLAKAAIYYIEVGTAAKQTSESIAVANQGFANQTAELKQTNAELEKAKQNEIAPIAQSTENISLPLTETPNYTKPSEILDDYRDSVGAAANIQQYFASEVDNATASLGSQSETLKALKKSLDEYIGSINGVEKFAKAEKELDRLKKKLAQRPQQPAQQQPNNQSLVPIKPANNPKPGNNSQPPAPSTPPNNQPPNNGGNGGNNNPPVESQQKLEQALERILTKMIKSQNKADASSDKDYNKNVAEQVKWQGELANRVQEKIDELNTSYPGWENGKSWQRHGENIAHARNDYSTVRADKQDLDTIQKLGKELQHNLELREELHDIDKNIEPVKYQNKQDDINKSKAEIARLHSEAKTKGLNTNEVTSDFLKSAAELQERLKNSFITENKNQIIDSYEKLAALQKQKISLIKDGNEEELNRVDEKIKDITADLKKMHAASPELAKSKDVQEAIEDAEAARRLTEYKSNKLTTQDNESLFRQYEQLTKDLQTYGGRRERLVGSKNIWARDIAESNYRDTQDQLNKLETEFSNRGLRNAASPDWQKTQDLYDSRRKAEQAVATAIKEREDAEKAAVDVTDKDIAAVQELINKFDGYRQTIKKTNKTDLPEYDESIKHRDEANSLIEMLQNDTTGDKNEVARQWAAAFQIKDIETYQDALDRLGLSSKEVNNKIRELSAAVVQFNAEMQGRTRVSNLQSELYDYLEKFPKVSSGLSDEVQKLQNALADPDAWKNANKLGLAMSELKIHAKQLGLESENLIDKFKNLFGQHLSTMITMAALHKMQEALRLVYQNVVEIDTAMTELRKVTNETDATYTKFMENAVDRAQRVGATISDTITATADFARLGYGIDDASSISDAALIYKNVGDGITDINTASESLISTMQAFNIQAKDSMKIVDEFNEAGNNFAISSAGVGEALQRSGAALAAANNTMEESIALATTMNRVIQNPETVGTTLKTVAMYLRSTKADVEAAGESTEGMAETTSKLRDSLKALSHGQVDIFDNATKQYKSTTDIIIEMGKAWDTMSDKEQAAALELMGGKRNANAVSALIQNYQEIEKVIETVSNASGSAEAENAKYLDSIKGRLTELNSTFQAFSTHVLDSDVPKFFIFIATAIVKAADAMVKFTGAFPIGTGILSFVTQLGKPKMTGFTIVPSNTPGGDTEQACGVYYIKCCSAREYLVKPTNMAA